MKLVKNLREKSNFHLQNCRVIIVGCKCDLCGRSFKCVTDLKAHNKLHHFTNTQFDNDEPRVVTDFADLSQKKKSIKLIFKLGDEILDVKDVDRNYVSVDEPKPEPAEPCDSENNEERVDVEDDDSSDQELTRKELEEKYRELRALNSSLELKLKMLTSEKVGSSIDLQVSTSASSPTINEETNISVPNKNDDEIVVCYDSRKKDSLEADDCEIIYHAPALSAVAENAESILESPEEHVTSSSNSPFVVVDDEPSEDNEATSVSQTSPEIDNNSDGPKENLLGADKNCSDEQIETNLKTTSPNSSEMLLRKRKKSSDELIEPTKVKVLRKNRFIINCGSTGIQIKKCFVSMNSVDQENQLERKSISQRLVLIASSLLSSVNR